MFVIVKVIQSFKGVDKLFKASKYNSHIAGNKVAWNFSYSYLEQKVNPGEAVSYVTVEPG
jgi:hypothetical protein